MTEVVYKEGIVFGKITVYLFFTIVLFFQGASNTNWWQFIVQVIIGLVGIVASVWVAMYLFTRQQEQSENKNYKDILNQLKELHQDLQKVAEAVNHVEKLSSKFQARLIDNQYEVSKKLLDTQANLVLSKTTVRIDAGTIPEFSQSE